MSELQKGQWEVTKYSPNSKGDPRMIAVREVHSPINHCLFMVGMDDKPKNMEIANLIVDAVNAFNNNY